MDGRAFFQTSGGGLHGDAGDDGRLGLDPQRLPDLAEGRDEPIDRPLRAAERLVDAAPFY